MAMLYGVLAIGGGFVGGLEAGYMKLSSPPVATTAPVTAAVSDGAKAGHCGQQRQNPGDILSGCDYQRAGRLGL
jgi:hypothetical protein